MYFEPPVLLEWGALTSVDIAGNIMNRKKLTELRRELREMYKSPQNRNHKEFISIAKQLGRREVDRGKEPTYVKDDNPVLCPPLSIPKHGELKVGTARSIIQALLNDVDVWEIFLMEADDD